jgi:hypothetical protein
MQQRSRRVGFTCAKAAFFLWDMALISKEAAMPERLRERIAMTWGDSGAPTTGYR